MLFLLWLYCKAQNLKATEKSDISRYLIKNLKKPPFPREILPSFFYRREPPLGDTLTKLHRVSVLFFVFVCLFTD